MTSPTNTTEPIGVIGLGLLGTAIAERLLNAGFSLVVHDLVPEKAHPLIASGARWSDNPLSECKRAVFCVYKSNDVRQIIQDFNASIRSNQIFIDATTGSPEDSLSIGNSLASRGVAYLESPFVASSEQTRRGEGIALVAGPREAFEACRDLYTAMIAKTHYLGRWGEAAKTKLVNNLILGLHRAALAEGLLFAKAMGLDLAATLGVLRESNSYSGVMDTKGNKMVAGDFATEGKLSQHAKDVRILLDQIAARGGRLPFSELHLKILDHAEAMGLGELDNSAIVRALANFGNRVETTN